MTQRGKKAKCRMICKLTFVWKLREMGYVASVYTCVVRVYHRLVTMTDKEETRGGDTREEMWEETWF